MAYLGTVAFVDSDHRVLRTLRHGALAEDGPEDLLARMVGDVRRARAKRRNLRILLTQDAAKEMQRRVVGALEAECSVRSGYELIDDDHAPVVSCWGGESSPCSADAFCSCAELTSSGGLWCDQATRSLNVPCA